MTIRFAAAALALSLLLSSPAFAQTATLFDLVCEGVQRDLISGEREDVTVRIRVDLADKKFCFDDCERHGYIYPIADPESKTIAYDFDIDETGPDHHAGSYREDDWEYSYPMTEHIVIRLDDLTLRHDYLYDAGEPASQHYHFKWRATCTRAPFGSDYYNKTPLMRRFNDHWWRLQPLSPGDTQ